MSRPLLPVIVSPWAGGGRPLEWQRWLAKRLAARYDLRISCPRTLGELTRAVRAEVRVASALMAAGGDGTLHHVVNAIGDAAVTLAPVPIGSGNDFCRGIGLDDPERAVAALEGGRTRAVDLLEINGRRVITVGGVGLVAASALATARLLAPGSRWRPLLRPAGRYAYLGLAGARILLHPRIAGTACVEWRSPAGDQGGRFEGRLLGAFLATLPTLGAGLRLPVSSIADDGAFELALLPWNRRVRVIRFLPRLRRGRPVPSDVLQVHRATEVTIAWREGTPVLGDGESLGTSDRVTVRVLPRRLRVVALAP